ncbi:hypothetical protein Scep_006866 [Stephania cephalantha]|uniref:Uncharacterized protein n=1 Tax=Stephania cephalantha TaxID=152367 RepID=A0AAP0KAD4_9MAGN
MPTRGDSRRVGGDHNSVWKPKQQRRQRAIRGGASGDGGQREAAAAAAAVHSTTTERRPRVNVPTTGGIQTTEGDGRPILLAPDGEMDAEAIAGEKKMKGEVKEDERGFKGLEYMCRKNVTLGHDLHSVQIVTKGHVFV